MHPVHYFVHVPKTAGVTIRTWLRQVYARDEVIFVYDGQIAEDPDAWTYSRPELLRRAGELPASLRVFFGHFAFDPETLLHPGCRGLGFVRDARARVVSWRRYVERHGAGLPEPLQQQRARRFREGATLRQVWDEEGTIPELDNGIVRMFANATGPVGEVAAGGYERALENVERYFDYVGHVDHFEAGMRRIAQVLGRPYHPVEEQNVSTGGRSERAHAPLPPEDEELIAACTEYDDRFVRWIGERFGELG